MAFAPGPKLKTGLLFAAVSAIMVLLGWLISSVILPLLLSSILYALLEPLVSRLQRRGMGRVPAILMVLAGALGAASLLVALAVPVLAMQVSLLRGRLPGAWDEISARIIQIERSVAGSFGFQRSGSALLDRINDALGAWSGQAVDVISGWLTELALWVVTVPLASFFLLKDYRSLRNMLIGLTPNRHFEVVLAIYHRVAHQLQAYFRGVMVESGVMAVITTAGFLLIGLPMAPVLGLLAGVLNIIPYVGPFLGLAPPILVAMTAGMGIEAYAGAAIVVLVAQLVDNVIVIPAVVARAADIHPLVALLGVIVAGNLFGLPGMVFAIPILSSSRIVYQGLLAGVERRPLH